MEVNIISILVLRRSRFSNHFFQFVKNVNFSLPQRNLAILVGNRNNAKTQESNYLHSLFHYRYLAWVIFFPCLNGYIFFKCFVSFKTKREIENL